MLKDLEIIAENASELLTTDPEAFALLRRQGFGASDSSIILDVNPFPDGTIEKLIEQKKSRTLTKEEIAISNLVLVRKGADLEPLIMKKFLTRYNIPEEKIHKPKAMYRVPGTPLTVNFDGVYKLGHLEIPVECKFISTFANKYYNMNKDIGDQLKFEMQLTPLGDEANKLYIIKRAEETGIPVYYYTQLQQQLLALNAPFGYLAGLFDKDWTLRVFLVLADKPIQNKLIELSKKYWEGVIK